MPSELFFTFVTVILCVSLLYVLHRMSKAVRSLQQERELTQKALEDERSAREEAVREATEFFENAANDERLKARKALREMEAAIDKAAKANQAKSDFLATMSHEIRTPMNAIMGMSRLIDASQMDAQSRRYLEDMQKSADALLSIINDILDFSKIEAGKMEMVCVDFGLLPLLQNVISLMRHTAHSKLLQFETDLAQDLPLVLYGDELRLRQVLLNIIGNAVKYTKAGKVSFSARRDGSELVFAVTDTGVGIREEDVERLFTAFEQLDGAKNRHIVGTGLGLAISSQIVELMGGRIVVESEYGVGSSFTVRYPFTIGSADNLEHTDSDEWFEVPEAKILVVDDNQLNLTVTSGMLKTFAVEADVVDSGYEALQRVKENNYNIVFMDHMMPEMDGIETVSRLRMLGYKELIVVALTANALAGARELFLENGFQDFLSKPVTTEAIRDVLRKWLPVELLIPVDAPFEDQEAKQRDPLIAALRDVDGLDAVQGVYLSGNDTAVYRKALTGLSESAEVRSRSLQKHLAEEDLPSFQLEIHGLKGVLLCICAAELGRRAQTLEDAAREGKTEFCRGGLPAFLERFGLFADKLREKLLAFTEDEARPMGDAAHLRELLCCLADAAEEFDTVRAGEILAEIRLDRYTAEMEVHLQELETELNAYRIENVGGLVDALLKQLTEQLRIDNLGT